MADHKELRGDQMSRQSVIDAAKLLSMNPGAWCADNLNEALDAFEADLLRERDELAEANEAFAKSREFWKERRMFLLEQERDDLQHQLERKSAAVQRLWAERDALKAEVQALEADAERWRFFLRTRPASTHDSIIRAIDAARGAQA